NVRLRASLDRAASPAPLGRGGRELLDGMRVPAARARAARLSRGEMRRVALARALLFSPPVIVADEPTASLDAESARLVSGLLVSMARQSGATAIVVTHDAALLARLDRAEVLDGGRLASPPPPAPAGAGFTP